MNNNKQDIHLTVMARNEAICSQSISHPAIYNAVRLMNNDKQDIHRADGFVPRHDENARQFVGFLICVPRATGHSPRRAHLTVMARNEAICSQNIRYSAIYNAVRVMNINKQDIYRADGFVHRHDEELGAPPDSCAVPQLQGRR